MGHWRLIFGPRFPSPALRFPPLGPCRCPHSADSIYFCLVSFEFVMCLWVGFGYFADLLDELQIGHWRLWLWSIAQCHVFSSRFWADMFPPFLLSLPQIVFFVLLAVPYFRSYHHTVRILVSGPILCFLLHLFSLGGSTAYCFGRF